MNETHTQDRSSPGRAPEGGASRGASHGASRGVSRARGGLVALNLALLAGLGVVSLAPRAGAQLGPKVSRVPGEYSVVGGATIGGVSSMIYVLDSANRELIALDWNDSTSSLQGVGYRDLNRDTTSDPDR